MKQIVPENYLLRLVDRHIVFAFGENLTYSRKEFFLVVIGLKDLPPLNPSHHHMTHDSRSI
jgi:hypothetical protein